MQYILIEYPKCSTCQKAVKFLKENNITFTDRHIVENTPTVEELAKWIPLSEKEIQKWFNTSGLKYKAMNLKEKLPTMKDREKLELLASDGMLIRRPILITDTKVLVGFKQNEWEGCIK